MFGGDDGFESLDKVKAASSTENKNKATVKKRTHRDVPFLCQPVIVVPLAPF
jgi:hypothetical protein